MHHHQPIEGRSPRGDGRGVEGPPRIDHHGESPFPRQRRRSGERQRPRPAAGPLGEALEHRPRRNAPARQQFIQRRYAGRPPCGLRLRPIRRSPELPKLLRQAAERLPELRMTSHAHTTEVNDRANSSSAGMCTQVHILCARRNSDRVPTRGQLRHLRRTLRRNTDSLQRVPSDRFQPGVTPPASHRRN